MRPIENRGRHRDTGAQVARKLNNLRIIKYRDIFVEGLLAVDLFHFVPQLGHLALAHGLIEHLADLFAEPGRRPPEMGFQNLSDIHARRHTERIEHDIDVRAVFEVRHVFKRRDLGDNTLVTVTTGHLVARLQLALHRHEDFDHLHHARRQFVAALELFDLVFETVLKTFFALLELLAQSLDVLHDLVVLDVDLRQLAGSQFVQNGLGDPRTFADLLGAGHDRLVQQQILQAGRE